jgi:hypothetical protein
MTHEEMKQRWDAANMVEETVDLSLAYWRRTISDRVVETIDNWYLESADDGYRMHLGWSVIGAPCHRQLYYHFFWSTKETHSAGHDIEADTRKIMRAKGAIFHDDVDETGKQIKVSSLGGHFGGSCDGVFTWPSIGIHDRMVLECKSTKTGSAFTETKVKGVQAAKPQHYVQQSGYAHKLGVKHCMYVMRNKNDSTLYVEIVEIDPTVAEEAERKAEFIILSNTPPPRISEKPSYYLCKDAWCAHNDVCHNHTQPIPNCRNCTNSKPHDEGKWFCEHWQQYIPSKEAMIAGCPSHKPKPW